MEILKEIPLETLLIALLILLVLIAIIKLNMYLKGIFKELRIVNDKLNEISPTLAKYIIKEKDKEDERAEKVDWKDWKSVTHINS